MVRKSKGLLRGDSSVDLEPSTISGGGGTPIVVTLE